MYTAPHTHTATAAKTRRLKSVSHGVRSFVQNGRGKIAPTAVEEEETLPQKRCDAYMGNDDNSSIYGWHPFRHNANTHTHTHMELESIKTIQVFLLEKNL